MTVQVLVALYRQHTFDDFDNLDVTTTRVDFAEIDGASTHTIAATRTGTHACWAVCLTRCCVCLCCVCGIAVVAVVQTTWPTFSKTSW